MTERSDVLLRLELLTEREDVPQDVRFTAIKALREFKEALAIIRELHDALREAA